jgi:hypothetical protein
MTRTVANLYEGWIVHLRDYRTRSRALTAAKKIDAQEGDLAPTRDVRGEALRR